MRKENTVRLEMAKERLQAYYEAEAKVLTGQEYRLGSRSLRRADLSEIRKAIEKLENEVLSLSSANGGRSAVFRILPRDL